MSVITHDEELRLAAGVADRDGLDRARDSLAVLADPLPHLAGPAAVLGEDASHSSR